MSKRIPFPTQLLPQTPGLTLEHVEFAAHRLTLTMQTTYPTAICPLCGTSSTRIHSHYTRTIADLPWAGSTVQVFLHVRKFFCLVLACPRRIFTERLPQLVAPYARVTTRFQEVLRLICLCVGW
ncbi:MAG: transposase family protein [Chloroflexota bacterium]|nr:transposase family protein [Chloroflexota bacterium]